jgi:hypothetical protein
MLFYDDVSGFWKIVEEVESEFGWQNTSGNIAGEYIAFGGNSGTLTVTAGEAGDNNINLLLGGLASFELTAGNTDTLGDLIISLEDAAANDPQILSEAFQFTVIPAAIYDCLYGSSAAALATEANATANKNTIVAAIPDMSSIPLKPSKPDLG